MTVFNTNYSSIDEAFGFLNPDLQQAKKKKKNKDPICELYNQRAHQNTYTDTDLVMYANQFNAEKYQKQNVYGRETMPKYIDASDQEQQPQQQPQQRPMAPVRQEFESSYDFQPSRMITAEEEERRYQTTPEVPVYHSQPETCKNFDEEAFMRMFEERYSSKFQNSSPATKSINYFDLILYIISGIILIFMMEQFVKIGMYMQQSAL
jgi:hypothetical protein